MHCRYGSLIPVQIELLLRLITHWERGYTFSHHHDNGEELYGKFCLGRIQLKQQLLVLLSYLFENQFVYRVVCAHRLYDEKSYVHSYSAHQFLVCERVNGRDGASFRKPADIEVSLALKQKFENTVDIEVVADD